MSEAFDWNRALNAESVAEKPANEAPAPPPVVEEPAIAPPGVEAPAFAPPVVEKAPLEVIEGGNPEGLMVLPDPAPVEPPPAVPTFNSDSLNDVVAALEAGPLAAAANALGPETQ